MCGDSKDEEQTNEGEQASESVGGSAGEQGGQKHKVGYGIRKRASRRALLGIMIACLIVLGAVLLFQFGVFVRDAAVGTHKYFVAKERKLAVRYGSRSWVLITGSSSGQGREFALEFARRGFNIVLSGTPRIHGVAAEIAELARSTPDLASVQTRCIECDFSRAFEPAFFEPFELVARELDVSILVNNVGHRVGWNPYHEMPTQKISDCIACGTLVQARLTHMFIPGFLARKRSAGLKSSLINITAQCVIPTRAFSMALPNHITLPHLSVYEASNAFGFFHGSSILAEYRGQFDILNITPGAVVTQNTEQFLSRTAFAVGQQTFVRNVIRMMGNVQGNTCAHWKHGISTHLLSAVPFMMKPTLRKTGRDIASSYMRRYGAGEQM